MISNRFYYSFTLLAIAVILSSCLGSSVENMDNTISRDAQITSVQMSRYLGIRKETYSRKENGHTRFTNAEKIALTVIVINIY